MCRHITRFKNSVDSACSINNDGKLTLPPKKKVNIFESQVHCLFKSKVITSKDFYTGQHSGLYNISYFS